MFQSKEPKEIELRISEINLQHNYKPPPISVDEFNQCFNELMNSQSSEKNLSLLCQIYKGAKYGISILKEQFDFLLTISLSGKLDEIEESLSIIETYSNTNDSKWFLSLLSPEFFSTMYQLINTNRKAGYAFSILHNCLIPPNKSIFDILTQMEIMPLILNYSHKYFALLLYSELLYLEFTYKTENYLPFLDTIVKATITNFQETQNDDYSYLLRKYAEIDSICSQVVVSNPEFINLFSPEQIQTQMLRDSLMKLIITICSRINISDSFIGTNVMQIFLQSYEYSQNIKAEKKQRKITSLFLKFFYYLSQTENWKTFILENNICDLIFPYTYNNTYKHINRAIQILCQIGLLNITDVIVNLLQRGFLNIIAEHLINLKNTVVIDCLDFLLCVESKRQTKEINLDFTEFIDLFEALNNLIESENEVISEKVRILLDSYE